MARRLTPVHAASPRATPLRAVLFDAVGTLLHAQPTVGAAYAAAARPLGLELSEAEARRRFLAAFRRDDATATFTHAPTSPQHERARWRQIVRDVFPELRDTDSLFAILWDHFADPAHWQLDPDFALLAHTLAARQIVVGLASNFDERLLAICAGHPPLNQLAHIFVSSLLGQRKPALAFFRAIELALNLSPSEILLVGDDPHHDYHAARRAGWRALLIDRADQHRDLDRIAALGELLPRLA